MAKKLNKKILIADDDDAILLCIEEIAEQEEWVIFFARDGQECLRLVESVKPSLIILDNRMPNLSGEEVLAQLSEQKVNIPLIFFSEKNSEFFNKFSLQIRILKKPFDLFHFINLVNGLLEKV